MAHPFSSRVDCSLDNTDGASENELWVQVVTQMLAIVNITITVCVPAYSSALQSRDVVAA